MREMNDLNRVLREGDPAAGDEGLSQAQLAVMRRQVLNAAGRPDVVRTPWQQPLAVAAMVALTVAAGILGGQRLAQSDDVAVPGAATPIAEDSRRQLQFATPGGTRIIWVFDPDFSLKKETLP